MSYDQFATTFSKSRKHHPWPELDAIISDIQSEGYMRVLDVGCGNGRLLEEWFKRSEAKQGLNGEQENPPSKGGRGIRGWYANSNQAIPYDRKLLEKAKENRKSGNPVENAFWFTILKSESLKKYKFTRQKPLLTYVVDFYCSELGLIIELDGDSHTTQILYDQKRTEELEKYGLFILRFSNQDVMLRPEGVLENLLECIRQRESYPPPPLGRGVSHPYTGNGKEALDITYLGIDNSVGMINEARKCHPGYDFRVIEMAQLENLKTGKLENYDAIVLLASFHHLETEAERLTVLSSLRKMLSPHGRIYMTNWNLLGQPRYEKSHRGNGDFDIKIGEYIRYYHSFQIEELQTLFEKSGFSIREHRIFEGGKNIFSIVGL